MEANMTKDIVAICAGFILLGFVTWTFGMPPKQSQVHKTYDVRVLADDPHLKLVSEESPYMRSER